MGRKYDKNRRYEVELICVHCNKFFRSYNSSARFCSPKCRDEYYKNLKELRKPVNYEERSKISLARISEVDRRASEIGLTYGQYVAKGLD